MYFESFIVIFLIGLCFGLEKFFPRIINLERNLNEDFKWFFINYLLLDLLFAYLFVNFAIDFSLLLKNYQLNLSSFNIYLQLVILLVITDFFNYFAHRILHTNKFLWNFHKLHHSIEKFNPLSAYRHSIYEKVYLALVLGLFTGFVAVNNELRVINAVIFVSICILQHSNINISIPKFISFIFITPHNHMYHHSKVNYLNNGQNFGFILTIWDRLFKTYYVDDHIVQIGLEDSKFPKTMLKKFLYPIQIKGEN